jgi:hypothetical protein
MEYYDGRESREGTYLEARKNLYLAVMEVDGRRHGMPQSPMKPHVQMNSGKGESNNTKAGSCVELHHERLSTLLGILNPPYFM